MSPALLLVAALTAAPQAEMLDFTAKWCGPCQHMASTVDRLQREGFPIRRVDVDAERDLANRFRISSIPAFVLVVNGREVARLVGAQDEGALRQLLMKIPRPAPMREEATELRSKKSLLGWSLGGDRAEQPAAPEFPEEPQVRRGQTPEEPAEPASAPAAPQAARDPIETAVRIRVKDARAVDYGSGTVIASRPGKALVLTCWHVFRDFDRDAAVEIDLFPNGPAGEPKTFAGKLVTSDEKADVALVSFEGCGLIAVSPLVPADRFPAQGDHVWSVGCGNGEPPTKQQHRVTRINPYEGPDATECTEMPVVGRSGGGLFDREGRVIGVCFAAVRETKTGVYVGAAEIHKLVHAARFSALVPPPVGAVVAQGEAASPAESEPPAGPSEPAGPGGEANPFDVAGGVAGGEPGPAPRPRPDFEPNGGDHAGALAALDAGAEVVCTIRPLQPGGRSEVIVINKASARFLRYLRGELDDQPVETSMRIDGRAAAGRPGAPPREKANFVLLAAAHVPTGGVALLARAFHNHGRF